MRVVYCQFSTVANNVGVRIWDAKPDHYRIQITHIANSGLNSKTAFHTIEFHTIVKFSTMLRVDYIRIYVRLPFYVI